MATDTRAHTSLTLADLCQAIADGHLPSTIHSGQYHVRVSDARRLQTQKPPRRNASALRFFADSSAGDSSRDISCSA